MGQRGIGGGAGAVRRLWRPVEVATDRIMAERGAGLFPGLQDALPTASTAMSGHLSRLFR